jgi:hypothetical protein
VLAFAILPPLQQFGIITGMTIIYAFLASVLVLPSLLVVWTKYAGPDWTSEDFENTGSDDPDGGAPAATAPNGGADELDGSAAGGAAAAATGDQSAAESESADAASASADAAAPTRELSRDLVQPGGTIEATVTVAGRTGRVALTESVRGGTVTSVDADPEPVEVVTTDDEMHVAWRADGTVTVTYEVVVDEDAPDGTDVSFVGTVLGSEVDVAGDAAATVVADIFERVFAQADVTDDDLAAASAAFRDGDLSADQYDRVVREWARDRPEDE